MDEYIENAIRTLKSKFNYDNLRPIQEQVIKETFNKSDIFVLSPTSSGKSLCYQLPALINPGITIVISPLKSLIYDQVLHLRQKKIPTTFICGDVSVNDKESIYLGLNIDNLKFKLLYTTPETLYTNLDLLEKLENLNKHKLISRFVIDEAHCVSTWGHDFRPHYTKLSSIKELFNNIPIMALTASATNVVQSQIKNLLKIPNCKLFTQSFYRDNLNIKILEKYDIDSKNKKRDAINNIIRLIAQYSNQSGIIYCHSRKDCEELSNSLIEQNISCDYYHSGISKKKKEDLQNKWLNNDTYIIIATIAFGMGIDKPDVRFVIHFNLPQTLEGYYQEIGRGGRDGKISDCILLNNSKDNTLYNKMIHNEIRNAKSPKRTEHLKKKESKLEDIQRYIANIEDCKHYLLSTYFGEFIKNKKNFCNFKCTNCNKKTEINYIDYSDKSKEIIGKIITTRKNTTKKQLIDSYAKEVFNKSPRLVNLNKKLENGLNKKEIKNEIKHIKNRENMIIDRLITHLILNKFIKIETVSPYNNSGVRRFYTSETLKLYKKAQDILNDNIKIKLPMEIHKEFESKPKKLIIVKKLENKSKSNSKIIDKLKQFRKEEAYRKNIPAYRIFSNKTLEEIVLNNPKSLKELNCIKGIGEKTINNYGEAILNML